MSAYFEISVYLRDTEDRNKSLEIRKINTFVVPLPALDTLLNESVVELTTADDCQAAFFGTQGVSK